MVVGLVLAAVPIGLWLAGAGTAAPATPPPSPAAAAAPAPAPSTWPTTAGDASSEVAPPVRVRLGGLGVDAPVVPVGVDDLGEMEVPEDVRTVGWYRFGPGPGSAAGSSVLSGHVDDRVQGRGSFFRLSELGEGDLVQVDLADGTVLEYRVRLVERIDKEVLPVDSIFTREGPPVLTLVTCGGDFDRATRNYVDNIVVTADPVSG
jgi:LPXTG-site transpeptidase (sortase) family protein